ncbi:LIM domain-binding protein 3 [Desmophyllum pertusum]|uniref:LIM domain-binding protein 3 n=1 Tax=Desmophyllum pertusum TaxID=174260 RepID=A0A9X0A2E7_9CNID|nr:LIM domain-binding protein 3 [Desmophyllum pertusum]
MAETTYTASLRGGGPWGFRLQGGKDFGNPLSISKVTPGSKADVAEISSGDYVLEVNGDSSDNMTHFDAQDAVRRAGQNLDLFLQRKEGPKTIVVTETAHSAKVDHKFNAVAKPFGASSPPQPLQPQAPAMGRTSPAGGSSWQPPTIQAQRAPVSKSGPVGMTSHPAPPAPPPAPPPSVAHSRGTYDHMDSGVSRPGHDDRDLAERFKLNISDDGDVAFADEPPTWGHPPDPKVQSKSFKRLQKHLDEEDDLPPPPPEAFNDPDADDEKHVQSRTFKMLQDAVEAGDSPGSVFDRPKGDRSKPSTTPLPKMYRPSPPLIKPAHDLPVAVGPAPVMARPGQPQPVALPGMVQMSRPAAQIQPVRTASQKQPSSASPAAVSPTSSPGQQEWKRTPTKPPTAQPLEETRTPFCDACGEEVFGPFVSAIGKAWHPQHFVCDGCGESLQNQGFIEEGGKLYCEKDFNKYFAPHCDTCKQPISGPCVQAVGKTFHPEHFICSHCGRAIGAEGFNVDRGKPYCEEDYQKLFCVKCSLCKRAIGGGERWVEAMGDPWHAACFKCQHPGCTKHLEGNQFYQYGGKPYCVLHGAP